MIEYAELHCHSYYSLLDGASSPEALVEQATALGLAALALTDHDNLIGAVRFDRAAQRAGLHGVIGAEVTLADGRHLTLLAENGQGYANLCKLITLARLGQVAADGEWLGKVTPALGWDALAEHRQGLIVLTGCGHGPLAAPLLRGDAAAAQAACARLLEIFGAAQLFVEVQDHGLPTDRRLVGGLVELAQRYGLRLVATNNVHYAERQGSRLRDALVAIRHNQSLTAARQAGRLPPNSNFALASAAEMGRRFAHLPQALKQTLAIAERCQVRIDFSQQRLPRFPTPAGLSEFAYLYQLCHERLPQRYPQLTAPVLKQLAHELDTIERAGLAGYFLIVWDIMRFAREEGILCQGRGSAANSIVAYLLAITSIDPLRYDLLFERFLSEDKFTMPDIDLDFQWDRREEVIHYVYATYGAAYTAMVCNVNTYRARSALRDLGKALDFPSAVIDRLAKGLDTDSPRAAALQFLAQIADETPHHPLRHLADLLDQIEGCPRHLSIHSGGMVITSQPLDEVVPLEGATMRGRVVCQWDKASVEDAGLIKLDLLALRTLGMLAEALDHIRALGQGVPDLDHLPLDDGAIYAMLQAADTIGVFQVESGAQQQMLPRLKPTCFEDLAIEVAIVRPGPIQGGAVHPYLRRRSGQEVVSYPHPCLEPVLAETLGVLLFQEQAIRVAVAAAGFTPGEADLLRRALARSRAGEGLEPLQARFQQGAARQGIDAVQADQIFAQLAGFAGFGFCKSHAMSFALIAYQSAFLKHYHPIAFYCALLNHRPGFYSAEVILNDARRHGVRLLAVDVNASQVEYTVERVDGAFAIRAGLGEVAGVGAAVGAAIVDAQPFTNLVDFCRRTGLPKAVTENLIRVGAFDRLGERRRLLWELVSLVIQTDGFAWTVPATGVTLPDLTAFEKTLWAYELQGHALDVQIMGHFRAQLREAGVLSSWEVKETPAGKVVWTAGLRVVTQRPATANGFTFVLLEDEAGLLQVAVPPKLYPQLRTVLREETLILVQGMVQRAEGTVNLLVQGVQRLVDKSYKH